MIGDIEGYSGREIPRKEYMQEIMINMGQDNYKELKELSHYREAWITATN